MDKDKMIFTGSGISEPRRLEQLPPPPPWREFTDGQNKAKRRETYVMGDNATHEIEMVNAALYLRRPLLITGQPGTGKSSLAHAVAHELGLDEVLVWSITSRSTLQHGLYHYDAIARLQAASQRANSADLNEVEDIGKFIRLGALGEALLTSTTEKPVVVLIDEIDKSDFDLPNDLLNLFEEGEFRIPELARLAINQDKPQQAVNVFSADASRQLAIPANGVIQCKAFPFVVLTSNGEREFPPAFLRRCLRLQLNPPDRNKILGIVEAHLGQITEQPEVVQLIDYFMQQQKSSTVAIDQLLNALYLVTKGKSLPVDSTLRQAILSSLER